MAKVLLAGDWHGNTAWATSVLRWAHEKDIKHVYQAGDFGFWPGASGKLYLNSVVRTCQEYGITLWITPGNHEDYTQIMDPETSEGRVPDKQVIAGGEEGDDYEVSVLPRGFQWEFGGLTWVSFGGAPSIDFEMRREGVSWWPEEMIRVSDLLRLPFDGRTDVMICHDAPDGGTDEVQRIIDTPAGESMWTAKGLAYAAEGRALMNKAVQLVNPRVFVHGHFHAPGMRYDETMDRTYLSLGMDGEDANAVIFDTDMFQRHDDSEPKELDDAN